MNRIYRRVNIILLRRDGTNNSAEKCHVVTQNAHFLTLEINAVVLWCAKSERVRRYAEIRRCLDFLFLSRKPLIAFTLAFCLPDRYAGLLLPQVNNPYESMNSLIPDPTSS